MAARWDAGGAGQGEERKIKVLYLIPYRGIRDTSRQISFEFLFIKTRPTTTDLVSSFNSASESVM